MILSKENILKKSHQGFGIYAYIIKEFYPKEKFLVAQHFDHPLRNPFNGGRATLTVNLRNGVAVHQDSELVNFRGDAFDFANQYFKVATREELYYLINQVMNLCLKVPAVELLDWLDQEDDCWRPEISYFEPPISNIFPKETLSLAEVHSRITGNDYKAMTEKLRSVTDPKERSLIKSKIFPYVTFSGVFEKRSDNYLKRHSQLITFDFDHLQNIDQVREQLLSDEMFETEILFTSPSGDGLKWIVKWDRFQGPHREYFRGVSNYLKQTYNLQVDESGKDLSRACFLAFDPFCHLHPRHRKLS